MRVLFFGTSAFAVPSLDALARRGHELIGCCTQPDRPKGRGLVAQPSPIKEAAVRLGIPVQEPTDLRAALPELQRLRPDLGIVIAYGRIVPREVLDAPRHGMLGLHPSRLPKYRGADPIRAAMLAGETDTAVTIFRLNERMDAGEIALQEDVPIDPIETAEELTLRLAHRGADRLADAVDRLAAGTLTLIPQDDRQATFTSKLSKSDGAIAWDAPAERIARQVRALVPWPGVHTTWHGEPLKVWAAHVEVGSSGPGVGGSIESAAAGSREPGTVIRVGAEGIVVATGTGQLTITELQAPGGRRMPARDFLAGHRIVPGERFGA